jgi:hypothetical protein
MPFLSLPEPSVARLAFDERPGKKSLVAVVNGVMGSVSYGDEIVGIENHRIVVLDCTHRHRVDVMNVDAIVNLVPLDAQIATFVSNDDLMTNVPPLRRDVKLLVDVTIETKCAPTNLAMKSEVTVSILEGLELAQLRIRPSHRSRLRDRQPDDLGRD